MSKEKELVPELRFPEFVNDKEWVLKQLIDTADKKVKWSFTGGPFGSNLKASDYVSKGIRIIQLQNIGDGEFIDDYKIYTSIAKADELSSCNIYRGEIILSKMGDPVGRACIIPEYLERSVMASDGIRLVVDEEKYSKYFIYSLINSKPIRRTIEKKATGSTRKRIGLDELKRINLVIPNSPKEQQKIASCLSSLDELIAAHSDKLEALIDHKRGLMQNLFPQEGQKGPNFRFREFEEDGEWEKKELKEIFNSFSGGTPSTSEKGYYGGKISFIRSAEISKEKTELYLTEAGLKNSSAKLVSKGDLLVALYGANSGDVAISKVDGAINQAILCLQSEYSNAFTCNFLSLKKDWIISRYIQGGQGNLSGEIIKSVQLFFPKRKEQQKIASCLSSLDDLITAQAEKVEQLQLHKKGLMQGLFPEIDA